MTHRKSRTKQHATGLRLTYCRRSGAAAGALIGTRCCLPRSRLSESRREEIGPRTTALDRSATFEDSRRQRGPAEDRSEGTRQAPHGRRTWACCSATGLPPDECRRAEPAPAEARPAKMGRNPVGERARKRIGPGTQAALCAQGGGLRGSVLPAPHPPRALVGDSAPRSDTKNPRQHPRTVTRTGSASSSPNRSSASSTGRASESPSPWTCSSTRSTPAPQDRRRTQALQFLQAHRQTRQVLASSRPRLPKSRPCRRANGAPR